MQKAQGVRIPPNDGGIEADSAGLVPRRAIARAALGHDRLTDTRIRAAKATDRPYKLADGLGLYLLIQLKGPRLWRLKYRHAGVEKIYSIGAYDEVSLARARAERDRAREWLRQGLDPVIQRRVGRSVVASDQGASFSVIAEEWYAAQLKKWSATHAQAQRRLIDRFLLPTLGPLPIGDIEAAHVLEALRAIERKGAHELLAKSRAITAHVFRYAIATGRAKTDPTLALTNAFTRPPVINRATVGPDELPALFEALAAVPAELSTKLAFYFQIATCVRPGEVRFAPWAEIDDKTKVWRIPPERMKMRAAFVQPLSPFALEILKRADELRQTRKPDELIFPGFTRAGHLSENAFTALLARAGFYGRQTAHGMRSAFATWAHEQEFDATAVELCLAHRPGGVAGVYNRGEYIPARRRILGAWAEHLTDCGLALP
jgi:integrase